MVPCCHLGVVTTRGPKRIEKEQTNTVSITAVSCVVDSRGCSESSHCFDSDAPSNDFEAECSGGRGREDCVKREPPHCCLLQASEHYYLQWYSPLRVVSGCCALDGLERAVSRVYVSPQVASRDNNSGNIHTEAQVWGPGRQRVSSRRTLNLSLSQSLHKSIHPAQGRGREEVAPEQSQERTNG